MSKETFARTVNDQHELDRLRLLLARMQEKTKRTAVTVELEPAAKGFRIVVTCPIEAQEQPLAELIARELKTLYDGALRFTKEAAAIGSALQSAEGASAPQEEP